MTTTAIQLLLTSMNNLITLPGRAAPLSKTNAHAQRPAAPCSITNASRAAPCSITNAGSRFAELERRAGRIPWARGPGPLGYGNTRTAQKPDTRNRTPERAAGATEKRPSHSLFVIAGFTQGKARTAAVAQLAGRWTLELRIPGSIPTGTYFYNMGPLVCSNKQYCQLE